MYDIELCLDLHVKRAFLTLSIVNQFKWKLVILLRLA